MIVDARHAGRNGNRGQAIARGERRIPDAGHACGDGHACDVITLIERTSVDLLIVPLTACR